MVERIEERIRNMVGPFYSMIQIIKENQAGHITNEKFLEYIKSQNIVPSMESSIKYLIDMSKIIDDHLPDGFDINELLDKTKYKNK